MYIHLAFYSKQLDLISFPGGLPVGVIEGKHLFADGDREKKFEPLYMDLFICSEKALDALATVNKTIPSMISTSELTKASDGKCRRVIIVDISIEDQYTFVPINVLLGRVLGLVHYFDLPTKLRLFNFVTKTLARSADFYPNVSNVVEIQTIAPEGDIDMTSPATRFQELRLTPEEFEASQQPKYEYSYRYE